MATVRHLSRAALSQEVLILTDLIYQPSPPPRGTNGPLLWQADALLNFDLTTEVKQ